MNIIVCIKQVPESDGGPVDMATGSPMRDVGGAVMNPEDKNALEEALRLKSGAGGGRVTALCMGPPRAAEALKEALALGADEAVLISSPALAGSDAAATAKALELGIRKLGAYDIILCGQQTADGSTAQVGPRLAALLGLPLISGARQVGVENGAVLATRRGEAEDIEVEAPLPALITAVKELNTPRYPSMMSIARVYSATEDPVKIWSEADIGADASLMGTEGSPTRVREAYVSGEVRSPELITGGDAKEKASVLVSRLSGLGLILKGARG